MSMDRKIKKKKWTFKRISLYVLGMLFLSFVLYSFLFADKRSKVKVDAEKGLLCIKGPLPGSENSLVMIKKQK